MLLLVTTVMIQRLDFQVLRIQQKMSSTSHYLDRFFKFQHRFEHDDEVIIMFSVDVEQDEPDQETHHYFLRTQIHIIMTFKFK